MPSMEYTPPTIESTQQKVLQKVLDHLPKDAWKLFAEWFDEAEDEERDRVLALFQEPDSATKGPGKTFLRTMGYHSYMQDLDHKPDLSQLSAIIRQQQKNNYELTKSEMQEILAAMRPLLKKTDVSKLRYLIEDQRNNKDPEQYYILTAYQQNLLAGALCDVAEPFDLEQLLNNQHAPGYDYTLSALAREKVTRALSKAEKKPENTPVSAV